MARYTEKGYHKTRILLPVSIFLIGSVFLFIGISRGEMGVVLRKAIRICLDCIGIG